MLAVDLGVTEPDRDRLGFGERLLRSLGESIQIHDQPQSISHRPISYPDAEHG